jgi:acyl-CoA thioesterase FadM
MDAKPVNDLLWTTDVRIRFSHCDPAGIVYFPRAFDILNGVVEDWFGEGLGLDYYDIVGRRRVGLGYAHTACDFSAPAMMGDTLSYSVAIIRIGAKSLGLEVSARRGATPMLTADLVIVATDLIRHVSIPIPDDIRAVLVAYQEKTA